MKKLTLSLILVAFILAVSSASAEQTHLSTIVPREHTLQLSCSEGGQISVNKTTLIAGTSMMIERHKGVMIEAVPSLGYKLEKIAVSSNYGLAAQGNSIAIDRMVQDVSIHFSFVRITGFHILTFDANGGTGSMQEVGGVFDTFILPECGFTAPEGMQFKAWQIGTNEYAAGTEIEVTENVTVIAIYESASKPSGGVMITSPTTDQIIQVYEGETATIAITAENAVGYQWLVNYGDGTGWHRRGDNQPDYTSTPVTLSNNGYQYKCVVTGINGSTAESVCFTLQVLEKIELPETGDNTNLPFLFTILFISSIGCWLLLKKQNHMVN